MVITTLLENTSCREDLSCEHGLSLYIEACGKRILFDAGQSDLFARNAQALGIDLGEVDAAVLSHGHYDHGGGLPAFFEHNGHAPVYLRRDALGGQYNAKDAYIGLPEPVKDSGRLVFAADGEQIAPGLTLYGPARGVHPIDSAGLTRLEEGEKTPDLFLHEQYLLIEEAGKRVLISGCSHRGIRNIARQFGADVLIGGFHFMKLDPMGAGRAVLEEAARDLMALPTVYYTGHCTGQAAFDFLKERMGDRLNGISTGTILEL